MVCVGGERWCGAIGDDCQRAPRMMYQHSSSSSSSSSSGIFQPSFCTLKLQHMFIVYTSSSRGWGGRLLKTFISYLGTLRRR